MKRFFLCALKHTLPYVSLRFFLYGLYTIICYGTLLLLYGQLSLGGIVSPLSGSECSSVLEHLWMSLLILCVMSLAIGVTEKEQRK